MKNLCPIVLFPFVLLFEIVSSIVFSGLVPGLFFVLVFAFVFINSCVQSFALNQSVILHRNVWTNYPSNSLKLGQLLDKIND